MNKRNLFIISLILNISIVLSFSADESLKPYSWARYGIGYQIFLRSFYDADGDGIGDIRGMIEKLDYLNDGKPGGKDLEINFVWLNPIFLSESYAGYDTIDYYSIDPKYGTMDDFKELIIEADKRGIKILLDLVLNHSSQNHPFLLDVICHYNHGFLK